MLLKTLLLNKKKMLELIDLSNWKKQNEIIDELYLEHGIIITPRSWRNKVSQNNKMFASGLSNVYITHSNSKGFKATTDYQEAKIGRNDYLKRAFNMLKKARECDKAFKQKSNYQIDFETGEIK